LLPVAVLQVVVGAVVPVEPDADERGRQEAVLSHDDEVGEEAAESLDHPCRRRVHTGYNHWYHQDDCHLDLFSRLHMRGYFTEPKLNQKRYIK